jgi:hypothetical protein
LRFPACAPTNAPLTMKYLTSEQQKVLCVIVLLLLVGLAVKGWRTANPPVTTEATQAR